MIVLDDLLLACRESGASTRGPVFARTFGAIAYDSRNLRPGDLFVAVRTDRADGHDFVEEACRRGASGVLVERPIDVSRYGATCIVVANSRAALIDWGRFVLARQSPEVIAVSGGVGKTTTETAIVHVLADDDAGASGIFQNGNLNDLFGLPVALGTLEPSHELAVIELASGRSGEMAELAALVQPQTVVLTNAASVHIDSFGNRGSFEAELLALVRTLPPKGLLVANDDEPQLKALLSCCNARILRFGFGLDADVRATRVESTPEGTVLEFAYRRERCEVVSQLLGRHSAVPLLAAAAVGLARGIPLATIAARLAGVEPLPGRLRALPGVAGCTILDDSQSSSTRSLAAALDALALFPPRRLLVVGDSPDVGNEGVEFDSLAEKVASTVDLVVALDGQAEAMGRRAVQLGLPADRLLELNSHEDVATALRQRLRAGDTVLVKGGESSRMERVVERILRERERASELLVRQNQGWKQRVFVPNERPTWIELDLDAVSGNVELLRELAGPADLMIVLKADAYGHGAVPIARTALLHGATMAGVACLSEAIELRKAGVRAPILLLGQPPAWQAREIVRYGLDTTVYSPEVAEHLSAAALNAGGARVSVHVKVDTGMTRLGLEPADVPDFVAALKAMPGLTVEGIFTHLATADEGPDSPLARLQIERFRELNERLRRLGYAFRYVHAANSAALVNRLAPECNLVRAGLLAYGLNPSRATPRPDGFRPALAFKSRIAQVKAVDSGACVSYGCTFVTDRPSKIAVIPVGYGDGFRRSPRDWGEVLVRGNRARVVGAVCMDMAMLDVTDIPGVKEGDEVVLIGRQDGEEITVDDVADRLGTINYEVVTQILPRVPRTIP
jgi:Alr-MurF fusion protein